VVSRTRWQRGGLDVIARVEVGTQAIWVNWSWANDGDLHIVELVGHSWVVSDNQVVEGGEGQIADGELDAVTFKHFHVAGARPVVVGAV